MALVKCPDCGKMVSSRVMNCPECGCPANFFENGVRSEATKRLENQTENQMEYKVFHFGQYSIKYPQDSEKFANLYGDYLEIGIEKYRVLCDIYKQLGDADSVARSFGNEAQRVIDAQIDVILNNLYDNGLSMTIKQFKQKYTNSYPISYEIFMDPFLNEYNNILGIQAQMRHDREVANANRARWSGGGFGMKGAIKGAVQAGILNAGSSMVRGLGNAVTASADGETIERKKQKLFEDKKIMNEICEGIVVCMNGLFAAYTDELYSAGKLGSRITIDVDSANAKYEAMMAYEKDKEKIFATVVECLGLYPASRAFYETVEVELEACPDWKKFKDYWHLNFLYKENEIAFLKTKARLDSQPGTLKLYQDVLIFEGENPRYNKKIAIGLIKAVEKQTTCFQLSLRGKFLLLLFETPLDDIWVDTLKNAMRGRYEKVSPDILKTREAELKVKIEAAKEYILSNYTSDNVLEALTYYQKQTGASSKEAREVVGAILSDPVKISPQVHVYPGTEDLNRGLFRGNRVVLWSGGQNMGGYAILTTRELIEIDIKKSKENAYDIYKMSRMKPFFLGLSLNFRYAGSLIEKNVYMYGNRVSEIIDKIKNMQKGIFD